MNNSLPNEPGNYALVVSLNQFTTLQIGRLGEFTFPAGQYIYLGSAQGSGGLQTRLGRHLRRDKRLHWHIDALRAVADVVGVYYTVSLDRLECRWSQALAQLAEASLPAPGFGASDCQARGRNCTAHLVCFRRGIQPATFRLVLAEGGGLTQAALVYTGIAKVDCSDLG